MLTSDGRAVHFHKNNQYFYWKFPKTPKEMLIEQQDNNCQSAVSTTLQSTQVKNEPDIGSLCVVGANQHEHVVEEEQRIKEVVDVEEKDTDIVPDIYEL
jgi:hypothetical protein